jgi:hypothetical protein
MRTVSALQSSAALYLEGCRHFFVAHLEEGIVLRPLLPADAMIIVMHGSPVGCEADLLAHGLTPVLNSLQQIAAWNALATDKQTRLPAFVQFDTGMARMGLSPAEVDVLRAEPQRFAAIDVQYVMSHLVSAEDQANPVNRNSWKNSVLYARCFRQRKQRWPILPVFFWARIFTLIWRVRVRRCTAWHRSPDKRTLCVQSPTCRAALFRPAIFRRIPASVTAAPGAAAVRHASRQWRSAMPMAGCAV